VQTTRAILKQLIVSTDPMGELFGVLYEAIRIQWKIKRSEVELMVAYDTKGVQPCRDRITRL